MRTIGTVPTALSKGAMQAGNFLLAHIFFCHIDHTQCMTNNHDGASLWSRMQKTTSFVVCALGCLVYALVKRRRVEKRSDLVVASDVVVQPLEAQRPPAVAEPPLARDADA